MPETRTFHTPRLDPSRLSQSLGNWFRGQGFEVQNLDLPGGDITIQARKGGWRNAVGLAVALNVGLRLRGESLVVEIGEGKWADKAAAAAVSMFVLWPLAITAGYGAWQQSKLPQQTFDFVRQYLAAA